MSVNSWIETLSTAQAAGTALTNTTTATSIIPAAAKFTIPANFLSIGKVFRLWLGGQISTVTAAPGTLTLDVRFGSVIVFNGGAMNLNVTAQSNATWEAEMILTIRALGQSTSANLIGQGRFTSRAIIGSATVATGGVTSTPIPDTAPAVGTGFDSTASQAIDVFAAWSTANASNSIQVLQYTLEAMN